MKNGLHLDYNLSMNIMKTKLVGLKELRLNLSALTKEIEEGKIRIIVLNKNKPVFEIYPIKTDIFDIGELKNEVKEARKQFKKGDVYAEDEVCKMFK